MVATMKKYLIGPTPPERNNIKISTVITFRYARVGIVHIAQTVSRFENQLTDINAKRAWRNSILNFMENLWMSFILEWIEPTQIFLEHWQEFFIEKRYTQINTGS